jgi:hypothetical protein
MYIDWIVISYNYIKFSIIPQAQGRVRKFKLLVISIYSPWVQGLTLGSLVLGLRGTRNGMSIVTLVVVSVYMVLFIDL